jgi:hypothetical protein
LTERTPTADEVRPQLVFATRIHHNFFMRWVYSSQKQPDHWNKLINNDIDQFIIQLLGTFQPEYLRESLSHGQNKFPKEGILQHQFWRGAAMCLKMQLAAEVSHVDHKNGKSNNINGEVDFWINSELKWAIELLRLGSDKGEHVNRFKENGKYQSLEPSHWRVIDFRLHGSNPHREENYIAVMMNKDFRSATVRIGMNKPDILVKFYGKLVVKSDTNDNCSIQ